MAAFTGLVGYIPPQTISNEQTPPVVSTKKWSISITLKDVVGAAAYLMDIINQPDTKLKKLLITSFSFDVDISAGGSYVELVDSWGGVNTPLMIFNNLFYKGYGGEIIPPVEVIGALFLDVKAAFTGRLTLNLFGYFETF